MIHLIKLSVGPEKLEDLMQWQTQRLKDLRAAGQTPELIHVTRHTPKRGAEVLDGGSIYWVIKGWICARQKMVELRPVMRGDTAYCGLIYDPEMIRVVPRQHRPFQGWRYFDPDNAPRDLANGEQGLADIPEEMRRELATLCLI